MVTCIIHIFYSHVGKYAYICTAKSIEIMDNVRISFEVENNPGFPVDALTRVAKRSVENFIEYNSRPIELTTEEYAELQRRSEKLRLHPETGIPTEGAFAHLRSLL